MALLYRWFILLESFIPSWDEVQGLGELSAKLVRSLEFERHSDRLQQLPPKLGGSERENYSQLGNNF